MIAYVEAINANVELPDGLSDQEISDLVSQHITNGRAGPTPVEEAAKKVQARVQNFGTPDTRGLRSEDLDPERIAERQRSAIISKELDLFEQQLAQPEQRPVEDRFRTPIPVPFRDDPQSQLNPPIFSDTANLPIAGFPFIEVQQPNYFATKFEDIDPNAIPPLAVPLLGSRQDGTPKGFGFLGPQKTTKGEVATEISIGVQIGGKEVEIPTLVPGLTAEERMSLLKGEEPSEAIVQKAVDHAKKRLLAGKSPFKELGEEKVKSEAQKREDAFASGAVKGFIGINIKEFEQSASEYPITAGIGFMAGGVGSLMTASWALRATTLPLWAARVGVGTQMATKLPLATAIVPNMIMTSATFGTQTFATELIGQAQEGKIDLLGLGTETIKSAGLGAFLGTTGAFAKRQTRIAAAGGIGFVYTKMNGGSNEEALFTAGIFATFEAVGGAKRDESILLATQQATRILTADYLKAKSPNLSGKQALAMADIELQKLAARFGGAGKIIKEDKMLEFLNALNEDIIHAIKKSKLKVEPKTTEVKPKAVTTDVPPPPEKPAGGVPKATVVEPTETGLASAVQGIVDKNFSKLVASVGKKVAAQNENKEFIANAIKDIVSAEESGILEDLNSGLNKLFEAVPKVPNEKVTDLEKVVQDEADRILSTKSDEEIIAHVDAVNKIVSERNEKISILSDKSGFLVNGEIDYVVFEAFKRGLIDNKGKVISAKEPTEVGKKFADTVKKDLDNAATGLAEKTFEQLTVAQKRKILSGNANNQPFVVPESVLPLEQLKTIAKNYDVFKNLADRHLGLMLESNGEFVSDGRYLIIDQEIATNIRNKFWDQVFKAEVKEAQKIGKQRGETISLTDAKKIATNVVKDKKQEAESQTKPDFKAVTPDPKKLVPAKFVGTKTGSEGEIMAIFQFEDPKKGTDLIAFSASLYKFVDNNVAGGELKVEASDRAAAFVNSKGEVKGVIMPMRLDQGLDVTKLKQEAPAESSDKSVIGTQSKKAVKSGVRGQPISKNFSQPDYKRIEKIFEKAIELEIFNEGEISGSFSPRGFFSDKFAGVIDAGGSESHDSTLRTLGFKGDAPVFKALKTGLIRFAESHFETHFPEIHAKAIVEMVKELVENNLIALTDDLVVDGIGKSITTTVEEAIENPTKTMARITSLGIKKKKKSKVSKKGEAQKKQEDFGEIVVPVVPEGSSPADVGVGAKPIDTFQKITKNGRFKWKPKNKSDKDQDFKLFEATKELAKKYVGYFGERWQPSGTLGIFYGDTKNIFFDSLNNISVIVHEMTHWLDTKNQVFSKIMNVVDTDSLGRPIYDPATEKERFELTKIYLDYYPGALPNHKLRTRMREGIAVLFQKFIEQPTAITEKYPFLVANFMKEGGLYFKQDMVNFVDDAQKIIAEYQKLSPLQQIMARIVSGINSVGRGSFMNIREIIDTEIFDNLYPYEALAKRANVRETGDDISLMARHYTNNLVPIIRTNMTAGKGLWNMGNDGNFVKVSESNFGDLIKMLSKKGMRDQFDGWLYARRIHFGYQHLDELTVKIDELDREVIEIFAENKIEKIEDIRKLEDEDLRKLIFSMIARLKNLKAQRKEIEGWLKNNEIPRIKAKLSYEEMKGQFVQEEKVFDQITDETLKILNNPLVDLLSTERYLAMRDREGYATLKRGDYNQVLGDELRARVSQDPGKPRKASFLMKAVGSNKAVLSPLMETMKNMNEAYRIALRQRIYNTIAKIAVHFPDLFQQQAFKAVPKDGKIIFPQMANKEFIVARKGGKWAAIRTNTEIRRILEETFDFTTVHILERASKLAARIFTGGTTGLYIPFIIPNFSMDQLGGLGNTQNKYKPIFDQIRVMREYFNSSDSDVSRFVEEYFALGGDRQTYLNMYDMTANEFFTRIEQEVAAIGGFLEGARKGAHILKWPVNTSEIMTRIVEYIKARENGKSQMLALDEAARVTVPFSRIGRFGFGPLNVGGIGRTVVTSAPYLKASFNTFRQFIRSGFQDPKIRAQYWFIFMVTTIAAMGGMAASLFNSSEDQKRMVKGLSPDELGSGVYFPHPKDKTKLIKIRVGQEQLSVATLMNMIMIQFMTNSSFTAKEWTEGATSWVPDGLNVTDPWRVMFSWWAQITRPVVELAFNKKTFPNVRPLETEADLDLPPDLRTRENSSILAQALGRRMHLSPIQVDHLIEGYGGRATKFLTGKLQPTVEDIVFKPMEMSLDLKFTGMRQLGHFWARKDGIGQINNALNKRLITISPEDRRILNVEKRDLDRIQRDLDHYRVLFDKFGTDDIRVMDQRRKILDGIDTLPPIPKRIKFIITNKIK